MDTYDSFARVYDLFMDGTPYDAWLSNILSILKKEGIEDGIGLDLGCGTGQMTRRLAASGYDMIGVDASAAMLSSAREKGGEEILYLCQDMRSFELYGTVAFAVSVCDCMNYLSGTEELKQVFALVNNYLDPKGLFLFDMNTPYKYREVLSDHTFAEAREDSAFIWDNYFDEKTGINQYELTLFLREKNGLFQRFEEEHLQRAFSLEEIENALRESGLSLEAVYDISAQDQNPSSGIDKYHEDAERILFVAREKGK